MNWFRISRDKCGFACESTVQEMGTRPARLMVGPRLGSPRLQRIAGGGGRGRGIPSDAEISSAECLVNFRVQRIENASGVDRAGKSTRFCCRSEAGAVDNYEVSGPSAGRDGRGSASGGSAYPPL